jgi:tetratricopeptide (TPR) repeat protein
MNSSKQKPYSSSDELLGEKRVRDSIRKKEEILGGLEDQEEKFNLLIEIGDVWQNQLKNAPRAITAYREAIKLKPDDRPTLHKLLPLYQAAGEWRRVLKVISRVAVLEEDPERQSKHYFTMGVIFRDELSAADEALKYFNLSLDSSRENLKSFEAIDRILTEREEWKALESAYREQLLRLEGMGRTDLECNIWHYLGELYNTKLNQVQQAAGAYKMAATLDPENVMRHEILADLYVALPNRLQDAITECKWLIRNNPFHADYYRALLKLYFTTKETDKAWCVCATLAFLQKADAQEQRYFEHYRTRDMIRTQERLDNQHWVKNLFHPQESIYIGKILEAVTAVTRRIKVQPIKELGLKKRQKQSAQDKKDISQVFYHAAQVLNLPAIPDLYIQKDRQVSLQYAISEPIASVCGNTLLSGYTPQDLSFIVGKHLSYYRPEHYIRRVLPSHAELKMLLISAIQITMPETQLSGDNTGALEQYVDVLDPQLEPVEREHLVKVVERFVNRTEIVDIKKWIQCVEYTGCRAGFLLCNDLEVAVRMIRLESATEGDLTPKEKIKDLVLFSVSDEYFRLREYLGITVKS